MLDQNRETLTPLVDQLLTLAARPEEEAKKALWARHNALQPGGKIDKIPVCLTFEYLSAPHWEQILGAGHLRCRGMLARHIELDLRKRIWAATHIPDDHVVWPALTVPAVHAADHLDWGVPLEWHGSGDALGAQEIIAPFAAHIDLSRLCIPHTQVDEAATAARLAQASELVDGRLPVHPLYQTLGESPFEYVVRMRGMARIFYDVYDCPEQVHALMAFVTDATLADYRRREAHGWINSPPDPSGRYQMVPQWRHVAAYLPPDFAARGPRISDEWPYISAQSASGLSPAMYEEFVHRYNRQIAALYTQGTVYYHGCERLDHKLDIIATLPNLRRHHVSPWSSIELAAQKYQGRVVLEVHTNPTLIAFDASREEMGAALQARVDAADGHPMSLCLTDIHNLGHDLDSLRLWAEAAQEVACRPIHLS